MLKKNPRYSKRINYDALKDLLADAPGPRPEDKEGMYTLSDADKSEGEMEVIDEDAGGGVGVGVVPRKEVETKGRLARPEDADGYGEEDAEGEVDEDVDVGSEKGDESFGDWGEAFEQEA